MKQPMPLVLRLWLTGMLVVGLSLAGSLAATHLSYVLLDGDDYTTSMIAAAAIPLLVAPPAYGWIALLTARLERVNGRLGRLAHSDSLTGLPNRRAGLAALEDRLRRKEPVTLVMIDIDHFKAINDRFGHGAGDLGLQHVAAILARGLPGGALVARVGGEEFLLLLAGTDGTAARRQAERLRAQIADIPLITAAGPYRMTASFGIAAARPGEEPRSLLSRADQALYQAKRAGRNRVQVADEPSDTAAPDPQISPAR
jgi:diguanylate cyclase (GGDEF)-like protein